MFFKNLFKRKLPSSRDVAFWSDKKCGVECVRLALLEVGNQSVSISELIDFGLSINAYKLNAGWVHKGLLEIAKHYGLDGSTEFFDTEIEKLITFLKDSVAIVSVSLNYDDPGDKKTSGHLVLVNRYLADSNEFEIFDPYKEHSVYVDLNQFKSHFSGRAIVFKR